MSSLTFDTLKFANKLKAAGVPPAQAEAEAEALSEVFEANLQELVTKKDLQIELAPIRTSIAVMTAMLGLIVAGIASLIVKAFF